MQVNDNITREVQNEVDLLRMRALHMRHVVCVKHIPSLRKGLCVIKLVYVSETALDHSGNATSETETSGQQ